MVYEVLKVTGITHGESISGKEWQKIGVFCKQTEGQYPKTLFLESMVHEIIQGIARLKTGDKIKASFDVESKEYKGKYYTTVRMWKFEIVQEHTELGNNKKYSSEDITTESRSPTTQHQDGLPF